MGRMVLVLVFLLKKVAEINAFVNLSAESFYTSLKKNGLLAMISFFQIEGPTYAAKSSHLQFII